MNTSTFLRLTFKQNTCMSKNMNVPTLIPIGPQQTTADSTILLQEKNV